MNKFLILCLVAGILSFHAHALSNGNTMTEHSDAETKLEEDEVSENLAF